MTSTILSMDCRGSRCRRPRTMASTRRPRGAQGVRRGRRSGSRDPEPLSSTSPQTGTAASARRRSPRRPDSASLGRWRTARRRRGRGRAGGRHRHRRVPARGRVPCRCPRPWVPTTVTHASSLTSCTTGHPGGDRAPWIPDAGGGADAVRRPRRSLKLIGPDRSGRATAGHQPVGRLPHVQRPPAQGLPARVARSGSQIRTRAGVAAAGNDARRRRSSRQRSAGSLGVGSLDHNNKVSSFSNYGRSADVFVARSQPCQRVPLWQVHLPRGAQQGR